LELARSDEFLGAVVDHVLGEVWDRAPTAGERAYLVAGTQSSGTTGNWVDCDHRFGAAQLRCDPLGDVDERVLVLREHDQLARSLTGAELVRPQQVAE